MNWRKLYDEHKLNPVKILSELLNDEIEPKIVKGPNPIKKIATAMPGSGKSRKSTSILQKSNNTLKSKKNKVVEFEDSTVLLHKNPVVSSPSADVVNQANIEKVIKDNDVDDIENIIVPLDPNLQDIQTMEQAMPNSNAWKLDNELNQDSYTAEVTNLSQSYSQQAKEEKLKLEREAEKKQRPQMTQEQISSQQSFYTSNSVDVNRIKQDELLRKLNLERELERKKREEEENAAKLASEG